MELADPIDIFISYRRADTKAISRLIYDDLCRRFGREHVFFDVDRLPRGVDFHRELAEQVARCSVLLVVIGDRWAEGPRPFADDDLVRIEVRAALESGIPILPILADGAVFPSASDTLDILKPLLRREPLPVDSGRDFAHHMAAVAQLAEQLASEHGIEGFPRQGVRSVIRTSPTLSNAPVATATLAPFDKNAASRSRRMFIGSVGLAVAAAVVFSFLRFTRTKAAPTAFAPSAPAAIEKAAPATISIQVSASPAEATLYLDGRPLPSNPYMGRMAADGTQHLIRAEAPGYASSTRAVVASREVAVILALARSDGQQQGEGKRLRQGVVSPSTAPSPPEPTTSATSATSATDDCKLSPYYMDSRNIKVVRPECLRSLQSP